MNKIELTWNVIRYNFNQNQISHFNVFDHVSFKEDILKKFKKHYSDKEKFIEELRSSAMYYFWCKSEYEIIISPWLGSKDVERKIDIYYQLRLNWDVFADYVWNTLLNHCYSIEGVKIYDYFSC